MKILSAAQIREWDAFTMQHEPIDSINLMERAAQQCFEYISEKIPHQKFAVFCGPGNNGGDGLAIARMLIQNGQETTVYLATDKRGSPDFEINLQRLQTLSEIQVIDIDGLPDISNCVVIDAIFGYGLNKPVTGAIEKIIQHINAIAKCIISIDVPSGLFADQSSAGNTVVKSDTTLTFQVMKLAFYMPENAAFTGEVKVLDIGLHPDFLNKAQTGYFQSDGDSIHSIYRPRNKFSHKGTYGNACLAAGSFGMMGASVLAAQGCMRSGVGKLTCVTCEEGYAILQTAVPEAMCKVSGKGHIDGTIDSTGFDVIGIGPGIGRFESHLHLLVNIFESFGKPMVIDADALNVLSEHQELFQKIPRHSIITPHPKEFERLFGKSTDDFTQRELAVRKAKESGLFIILKGRYTFVATPEGNGYFNSTGNPGMATAGAGDVLTGILTGLLAQHYSSIEACLLGVYLHGLAGDIAAKEISEEALVASYICKYLGKAFLKLGKA